MSSPVAYAFIDSQNLNFVFFLIPNQKKFSAKGRMKKPAKKAPKESKR